MFDATLPSEPESRVRVEGRAELSWVSRNGETGIGRHYNTDPLRLLFPRTETGQPQTAVLLTTSGGLVGGDRLDIEVSAADDADGLVMTQAAEKVYRSAGPETRINIDFDGGPSSSLEWLPHETILFDGARLSRRTRLNLADGARAIAGEMLVLGRIASGEVLTTGAVRETWEVRRNGRLIWADAFRVDGDWRRVLNAAAGLAGATSMATIICAAERPELARDAARRAIDRHESDGLRAGASIISGLVVVRFLAADPRALRRAFAETWGGLRSVVGNFSAALPRLWHM